MFFQVVAVCVIFFAFIQSCQGIVLSDVGVPPYALKGKKAVLSCDFDLEHQELYAVKWYKNGEEFYRFVPGNKKPITVYARLGVQVDKKNSNARQITLENLDMHSMGRYRCEVSTEGPSFATVSEYGDMIIVVLPSSSPIIEGGKQRYRVGDDVNVNCTSPNSKPAADLIWYINGEEAGYDQVVNYPIQNTSSDLHTSKLGLHFKVNESDFTESGDIKLKCAARIGTYYWKSNEKSAEPFKIKRASFEQNSALELPNNAHGLSSLFSNDAGQSSQQKEKSLFLFPFLLILLLLPH